jgi:aryl-alcohol dehydrogenase-like predicted oxidoreductase
VAIPTLEFGRTGHRSTRTLFGAAALGRVTQEEADAALELLLRHGVNHIDTAASYGDSELRIGPWMAEHRGRFFLATKTNQRTYAEARAQIHASLDRLRVESVDLIQLHNLVDEEEWRTALGPGGALEAAIEARDQGLVRYIGVTGHGVQAPAMHKRSLERFGFDSVLFPYNYVMMQNPQYAADVQALLDTCETLSVAVQTIKGITLGPWGEQERTHRTWYEPLSDQADIDRAVHWVFGNPAVFLNTAGDLSLLPRVLDAAERFRERPPDAEMQALVERREMSPLFV